MRGFQRVVAVAATIRLALAVPLEHCSNCQNSNEISMLQVSRTVAAARDSHQESKKTHDDLQVSSVDLVDFVYCWSGETRQQSFADGDLKGQFVDDDHVQGYGFNEMKLSIRSLQLYAPWFHKAYLLVDGSAQPPAWAANDSRIEMVDRCMLFPRKSDCPTHNLAACQSIVHRVPGLLERFLFMEDDFIFIHPVTPSMFFSPHGKPFITTKLQDSQLQEIYGPRDMLMSGPDMPPEHLPRRVEWFVHGPLPMTISFSTSMELEYSDWYSFVRSHKTRFTCCDASVRMNGLAEHFLRIYPAMLHKHGAGVQPPHASGDDHRCECGAMQCIKEHLANLAERTLTLQNCHKATAWQASSSVILEHMDAYSKHVSSGNDKTSPSHSSVSAPVLASVSATDLVLALAKIR